MSRRNKNHSQEYWEQPTRSLQRPVESRGKSVLTPIVFFLFMVALVIAGRYDLLGGLFTG